MKYETKFDEVEAYQLTEKTKLETGEGIGLCGYNGKIGDYLVIKNGRISIMEKKTFEDKYQLKADYLKQWPYYVSGGPIGIPWNNDQQWQINHCYVAKDD